jgi:ABC-2 type transport system ATP-binding protein
MIEINNLTVKYGSHVALDHCTFAFSKCEIVGVLGPNGSGKTTLIKALTGLIKPFDGSIKFSSSSTNHMNFGVVLESPGLFLNKTVSWNLNFYLTLQSLETQKMNEVVQITGIHEYLNQKCSRLSLGQRQRVSWARSLLTTTDFYIFDDPTIGLDPHGIYDLRSMLTTMKQQTKGILITSHNLTEMEKICDRVLLLKKGITYFYGDTAQLNGEYGSLEIAYRSIIKNHE